MYPKNVPNDRQTFLKSNMTKPTSSEGKKRVLSFRGCPTKIETNPFSLNPFAKYPLSAGENEMEEKVKPIDPFRNLFREIPQGRNNPFTGNPFVEDCDFFSKFDPRALQCREEVIDPCPPWTGQPEGWIGDNDGWASFDTYDPVQVMSLFGTPRAQLIEDMKAHWAEAEKKKIILDEIGKKIRLNS